MRMSKLMNFDIKINMMMKRLMNKINIIMRFNSRLRLIFYIEYNMNFDDVCDDVELNIKKNENSTLCFRCCSRQSLICFKTIVFD